MRWVVNPLEVGNRPLTNFVWLIPHPSTHRANSESANPSVWSSLRLLWSGEERCTSGLKISVQMQISDCVFNWTVKQHPRTFGLFWGQCKLNQVGFKCRLQGLFCTWIHMVGELWEWEILFALFICFGAKTINAAYSSSRVWSIIASNRGNEHFLGWKYTEA